MDSDGTTDLLLYRYAHEVGFKYGKSLKMKHTMNYPKKTGINLYQFQHCAYLTYSVKTWFLKNLSVVQEKML